MTAPRLRQLVIAAETLEAADQLGELLELGAPFVDPGVKEFGLENRVYALGDQFLEVVVPMADSAPARRFIDRVGEGGYMAIFQTDDLNALRARVDGMGIRRVWNIDLPTQKIGTFDTELVREFFQALSTHGGITLHLDLLHGINSHGSQARR